MLVFFLSPEESEISMPKILIKRTVCATPMISRFFEARGRTAAWIGVGAVKHFLCKTCNSFGCSEYEVHSGKSAARTAVSRVQSWNKSSLQLNVIVSRGSISWISSSGPPDSGSVCTGPFSSTTCQLHDQKVDRGCLQRASLHKILLLCPHQSLYI